MARGAAAAVRTERAPRRRQAPPHRRPSRGTAATGPARRTAPTLARIIDAATHTLIDRLLVGRIWVGCIGVLLAGIVGLNVSLLELNREIARTTTRATALDRQNSHLRAKVAALDSSERIQSLAERRGMVMPAPGEFRYLHARPWLDAELATRRVVAPEPPARPAAPPAQLAQAPATTPSQAAPTTATPTQPATGTTTTPSPTPAASPPAAVATP